MACSPARHLYKKFIFYKTSRVSYFKLNNNKSILLTRVSLEGACKNHSNPQSTKKVPRNRSWSCWWRTHSPPRNRLMVTMVQIYHVEGVTRKSQSCEKSKPPRWCSNRSHWAANIKQRERDQSRWSGRLRTGSVSHIKLKLYFII